jgi:acetyl esterase/lipase
VENTIGTADWMLTRPESCRPPATNQTGREKVGAHMRYTNRLITSAAAAAAGLLAAALLPAQTDVVMLYPNGAPGSESWTQKETVFAQGNTGLKGVRNIVKPSITVYLPPAGTATGTSVVIAPGGAFRFLSWDLEGTLVADWLQKHGVAAFILKYRVSDTGTEEEFAQSQARGGTGRGGARAPAGGAAPGAGAGRGAGAPGGPQTQIRAMAAADGLRAMEVIRQRAGEWRIDPDKVGIMGFSAGGYVAVQAALDHTAANRPAFVASIYACCEDPAQIKVPDDAPPIFFLHAYNDPVSTSSPSLYLAWKAANKPAELHTYAAGGHGFGMPKHDLPTDGWIERFGDWLRYQKLMK